MRACLTFCLGVALCVTTGCQLLGPDGRPNTVHPRRLTTGADPALDP